MFRKITSLFLALILVLSLQQIPAFANVLAGNPEFSRQIAADSMVLLENDGTLPLRDGVKVAAFGRTQMHYNQGGGGSGVVYVPYVIDFLTGLQNKHNERTIELDQALAQLYKDSNGELSLTSSIVSDSAAKSDVAVVFIGRYAEEGADRSDTPGDYQLSQNELDMFDLVSASFDNIVVVLNVPGVVDTQWIKEYPAVKSVLLALMPGMEGGNATADVLCGDVNPSGKLTDTYATAYEHYPSSDNFSTNKNLVKYVEDIYVGYRYFETVDPDYETVSYEFGYGKSYSDFTISNKSASIVGDDIVVKATVKNNGPYPGKEVVQVYYCAPNAILLKPAKELAAFAKTKLLDVNESQELTMTFAINDMASYDDLGKTGKISAYVLEAGDYPIYVGNSVKDAGKNEPVYTYKVDALTVAKQLTPEIVPYREFERVIDPVEWTTETLGGAYAGQPIATTGNTVVRMLDFYDTSDIIRFEDVVPYEIIEGKYVESVTEFKPGEFISFKIAAEEAGDYDMTLQSASQGGSAYNCLEVYVDDVKQDVSFDMLSTGGWFNFIDTNKSVITLPKGDCILTLKATKSCLNTLSFTLAPEGTIVTPDPDPDPTPIYTLPLSSTDPTNFSAELYSVASDLIAYADDCLNNFRNGQSVTYFVDAEKSGQYEIALEYASDWPKRDNCLSFFVNGKYQEDINFVLTRTSGWGSFVNSNDPVLGEGNFGPHIITLPAGVSYITLSATQDFGNVRSLTLIPIAEPVSATPVFTTDFNAVDTIFPDSDIKLINVYDGNNTMEELLAQMSIDELINLVGGHSPSNGAAASFGGSSKYGIPDAQAFDGPAGIRTWSQATAWPVSTNIASTWDIELIEAMGVAVGKESVITGVDAWLAPGMNIHRDPLCGRNFEYYSEDPLVSGKIAAALTRGYQSQNVAVTLKHFVANNQELNRGQIDTLVSERALREIYLKGFEIAVKESDPWSIMSSYNLVNGIETSERYDLLTTILREEWDFDGLVMTDWGNRHSAHWMEVLAGNDLRMPNGDANVLEDALAAGQITREDLELNASRVATLVMKTNTFLSRLDEYRKDTIIIHNIKANDTTRVKATEYGSVDGNPKPETCSDIGGGSNMAHLDDGSSITYYINVEKDGLYDINLRTASDGHPDVYDILVDNVSMGEVNLAGTNGWQDWKTVESIIQVPLTAGEHFFTFYFIEKDYTTGSNLNWFEFVPVEIFDNNISVDKNFEIRMTKEADPTGEVYNPEFAIKNIGETASEITAVVASYNENGAMVDVIMETLLVDVGTVNTIDWTPKLIKSANATTYKFFIWNSDVAPMTGINQ